MSIPDNTPVIVGAATVSQRQANLAQAAEASQLMIQAAEAAAQDTGATQILQQLDTVAAMSSLSGYLNPAKLVATAVKSPEAKTLRADPGILQQEVFSRVSNAIQKGQMETALVVSGEASYRTQQARFAGEEAPITDDQTDANEPDTVLAPDMVIHAAEIEAGLVSAVSHYAMLENAYRCHRNQTKAQQAQETAELWSRFSQVASQNPHAWNQNHVAAHDIATASPKNRMMAYPYTKNHCSQMNVDQAAAILFCSAGKARALGISPDKWIFPHGGVVSNHAVTVLERVNPHASPGFKLGGQRILELCGVAPQEADLIDLYSCFPVAVKVQATELGLSLERQLTITGGMTFAGGPLNSYVLHSLCAMVEQLRQQTEAVGMITSISGMITKQGIGMLSAKPPETPARFEEITSQVGTLNPPLEVAGDISGEATTATYTVLYERSKAQNGASGTATDGNGAGSAAVDPTGSVPVKGIAVAEFSADNGRTLRRLATTTDPEVIQAMLEAEEFCGQKIRVAPQGSFSLA